jgi:hypothetical protein
MYNTTILPLTGKFAVFYDESKDSISVEPLLAALLVPTPDDFYAQHVGFSRTKGVHLIFNDQRPNHELLGFSATADTTREEWTKEIEGRRKKREADAEQLSNGATEQ